MRQALLNQMKSLLGKKKAKNQYFSKQKSPDVNSLTIQKYLLN